MTLTAYRVDPEARLWQVINTTRRKTGDPLRPVMLTDIALELTNRLLARHPEGPIFRNHRGRPWTRNAMACNFAQVRQDLGYGPEVTAYAFRHRYGTDALLRGQEVATVATVLGHKSTVMIMRHYSHLRDEHAHLTKAALAIRPGSSPAAGNASAGPGNGPAPIPQDRPAPRTTPGKPEDPPA